MENKKISIIIPAYNVADYIAKCLQSIINQTYRNLEIIVVDDGSEDATGQILDEYSKKDERIRVIHQPNQGVSVARNAGIGVAVGEYYFFFDGDDFMEPDTVENVYRTAREQQADTVIYGYYRYEKGTVKETCFPRFEEGLYRDGEILERLLPTFVGVSYENVNRFIAGEKGTLYVENPALWRCMVSAEVIRNNHLIFKPGLKVGEDTVFISEYLSCAKRCYVLRRCFYYLVTRETSTIYVYEENPLSKLEGKMNLLAARQEITERILERTGVDIGDKWKGTVLMSVMELAFLLAPAREDMTWIQRWKIWKTYAKHPEVLKTVKEFPLKWKPGILIVPFLLMKLHLSFLLFIAVTCLSSTGYTFQRS
ncbi:MAG: glycosyltransferase [Acetatifactor sp.]|nr:glycosyltransferase [Acetatifactor sp.]